MWLTKNLGDTRASPPLSEERSDYLDRYYALEGSPAAGWVSAGGVTKLPPSVRRHFPEGGLLVWAPVAGGWRVLPAEVVNEWDFKGVGAEPWRVRICTPAMTATETRRAILEMLRPFKTSGKTFTEFMVDATYPIEDFRTLREVATGERWLAVEDDTLWAVLSDPRGRRL